MGRKEEEQKKGKVWGVSGGGGGAHVLKCRTVQYLGAVAMVDVPVYDEDPASVEALLRKACGHRHVVVDAEPHAAVMLGVVPWRPDHRHRVPDRARAHGLRRWGSFDTRSQQGHSTATAPTQHRHRHRACPLPRQAVGRPHKQANTPTCLGCGAERPGGEAGAYLGLLVEVHRVPFVGLAPDRGGTGPITTDHDRSRPITSDHVSTKKYMNKRKSPSLIVCPEENAIR